MCPEKLESRHDREALRRFPEEIRPFLSGFVVERNSFRFERNIPLT
jgi:hypothetical protein